jgi:hypothetical protein
LTGLLLVDAAGIATPIERRAARGSRRRPADLAGRGRRRQRRAYPPPLGGAVRMLRVVVLTAGSSARNAARAPGVDGARAGHLLRARQPQGVWRSPGRRTPHYVQWTRQRNESQDNKEGK